MQRWAFKSVPLLGVILLGTVLILRRSKVEIPHQPLPPLPKAAPVERTSEAPPTGPVSARDADREAARAFKSAQEKLQGGDPKGAIADYDRALSLKKDWGEAFYNRAGAKSTLKDYSGAILDYGRVIDLNQRGAEAYYNRGVAQLALRHPQEALGDFDHALVLRGDWPEAFYNRGLSREGLSDYRGAEKDYLQALKVAPPTWPSRPTLDQRIAAVREKFKDPAGSPH